jgi:small-conductance mechanosensitive channel
MNPQNEAQQILRNLEDISLPTILVVVIVAGVATWIVQRSIPWFSTKLPPRYRFYVLPIVPILRLFIVGLALLQVLTLLIQPTSQNFIAIAGASAVAIGFAFKDYAASIVAGVVALIEQPYRPGDWVEIGGNYGEVQTVGLRSIKIVTPDDNTVTIPHGKLWTENIVNANNGRREHMCIANFYLDPHHDGLVVEQVLHDVAITSPYIKLDRRVLVIIQEQPWATHYSLRAYPIEGRNQFIFTSDLTVRAKDALAALGITSVHMLPASAPEPIPAGTKYAAQ